MGATAGLSEFLSATNIALVLVAGLAGLILFNPAVFRAPLWHATVTPLASIIGSGFLIAGPLLNEVAGPLAVPAMAGLCLAGLLYGSASRTLILHFDPRRDEGKVTALERNIDRLSDLSLVFAYFISVAYYLNLFAAFGLRLVDVTDPVMIRLVASAMIAVLAFAALLGGLAALEKLELGSVGLKLSVIAGLIAALLVASIKAGGSHILIALARPLPGGDSLAVVLGLVILVQGFETSRYLGEAYSPAMRVHTMMLAQAIATAIYLVFILMGSAFFEGNLPEAGAETAIIDMLRPLAILIGPLLILAALASQFSAAIADASGAGGLIAGASKGRLPLKVGALMTAGAAAFVTWTSDIFEIVTYASKAFVFYYGITALLAARVSWGRGDLGRSLLYGAGVVLALAIIVLAVPASV